MEAATRADECSHGRRHHRDSDRDRRQELEKEGKTEGNEESARNVLLAEAGDRIECAERFGEKKKKVPMMKAHRTCLEKAVAELGGNDIKQNLIAKKWSSSMNEFPCRRMNDGNRNGNRKSIGELILEIGGLAVELSMWHWSFTSCYLTCSCCASASFNSFALVCGIRA